MNWATRCPSCTTVFRVAEDQLRVSDGFVRCGRCDAVFDARSHLFDLSTGLPLQPSPVSAPAPAAFAPPPAAPLAPAPSFSALPEAAPPAVAAPMPAPAPPIAREERFEQDAPAAPAGRTQTEPGFAPTEWPHTHVDEPDPLLPSDCAYTAAVAAAAGTTAATTAATTEAAPQTQTAQRMRELLGDAPSAPSASASRTGSPFASLETPAQASRWQLALAWLGLASLALALPLQWAWIERDALRAQWPALEALWQQACGGCEPALLTRLDGLVVAASSLQPTPQGQAYQLQLRVENRADHALRMPWVDLQLSDESGRPLLRRSLSPTELGLAGQLRLEAGASAQLHATFKLEGRLAGYEVGLFHP